MGWIYRQAEYQDYKDSIGKIVLFCIGDLPFIGYIVKTDKGLMFTNDDDSQYFSPKDVYCFTFIEKPNGNN